MTDLSPLARDGIMTVRPNAVPVRNFQVFGERSSGTNFVSHVIGAHMKIKRCKLYGWKHGFPSMSSISPRSLIVVLFRDAFDWTRSMYNKPWHAEDALREMAFSDFLRAEWRTEVHGPINSKDEVVETKFAKPLQQDRDPLTGRRFANLIALRNAKTRGFLSFAERECNLVMARYETVAADPEALLRVISETFEAEQDKPYAPLDNRAGKGRWGRSRPRSAPKMLHEADRDFVLSELDLAQEAVLGYDYSGAGESADSDAA